MPTNGDATGQEPPISSPDGNGQEPPTSQVSSTSDKNNGGTGSSITTLEDALGALEKARKDQARYRVDAKRLAELEAIEAERANAALSDKERHDKQRATDQARIAELETKLQDVRVGTKIDAAAASLGMNPALANRILDRSALEYGEDGNPTNVAELLLKTAQELDISVTTPGASNGKNGHTPRQAQQQPSGIGATPANPARNTSGGPVGGWSWDVISGLSKEQYDALSTAERSAMAQFIMTHPQARGR